MKLILLSQGYHTKVDDGDYEWLSQWSWYAVTDTPDHIYACNHTMRSNPVRMHRLIMGVVDAGYDVKVDHLNHDTLDNQRHNLKLTTHAGNLQNRRGANSNSTTGVRGVSYSRQQRKYHAYVRSDYVRYHLGSFDTLEEAALAAADGRRRHHAR
jgi:hypothetical protein